MHRHHARTAEEREGYAGGARGVRTRKEEEHLRQSPGSVESVFPSFCVVGGQVTCLVVREGKGKKS